VRVASRFIDEIDPAHVRVESLAARPFRGSYAAGAGRGAGSAGGSGGARTGRRRGRGAGAPVRGTARGRRSSAGSSDGFPDYEGFSQERSEFGPGVRVRHPRWGEGVVLEISGLAGDAIVRVRFDNDVEKRIMLRYGKLEVLSD
jgi:DNA helicase-2/ATP-dependent DNA helicase PcrA